MRAVQKPFREPVTEKNREIGRERTGHKGLSAFRISPRLLKPVCIHYAATILALGLALICFSPASYAQSDKAAPGQNIQESTQEQDEDEGVDIAKGQAFAQQKCSKCHNIARSGPSPLKPAPPFRDLSKKYPLDNLAEALAEGIVVGHPDMPEFKLEPYQINNLLGFIAGLNK